MSVEGDQSLCAQHLFNVTVLRICIYEREYNDDDVVLLIKRAHSIGLGHSRQAKNGSRRESQVCANYCVSSSNSKKHDAYARAEFSKVRLLHGRRDLPRRRARPYVGGLCEF